MSELTIFAKITPKPQHFNDAREAIKNVLLVTRSEPGCRTFAFHQGAPADGSLYLYEVWKDEAALSAHYAQPYIQAVFNSYKQWLAEEVEIKRLEPLG